MLDIKQLRVVIDNKVLLNIDHFQLEEGEVFSVLGKNGAGKSTLFKSICGDIPATGQRYFHQQDIERWPRQKLARHLAVLPQSSQLNFPFSVQEVAALGLIPLSINRRQGMQLVKAMLALTDTLKFAVRPYLSLSGGERQRVHLARVLVQLSQAEQPPLLLLDEPTSAQDLAQQHRMLEMTRRLCNERHYTVLVIMHDLNLSLRYADRVGLLHAGYLVDIGKPDLVLTPANVEQYWGYCPQQLVTASGQCVLA